MAMEQPRRIWLPVVLILLCVMPPNSLAAGVPEFQVKAAVIFRLTKFISWPDSAFQTPTAPLNICTLGGNPLVEALKVVEGKRVRDRWVVVEHVTVTDVRTAGCHVVVMSGLEQPYISKALRSLAGLPALTVADQEHFAKNGGMVNLRVVDSKVRFEINVDVARQAGLVINAQLLRLATVVSSNR